MPTNTITSEQIQKAKDEITLYNDKDFEHDDCIRIAYEWLDAQNKTQNIRKTSNSIKHLIEKWGGRYVSQSDVEVAAHLHTEVVGKYPLYNLSSGLTEPKKSRLNSIDQAFSQDQRDNHDTTKYKIKE